MIYKGVIETFPGTDGLVRVVKVQGDHGDFIRTIDPRDQTRDQKCPETSTDNTIVASGVDGSTKTELWKLIIKTTVFTNHYLFLRESENKNKESK